MWTTTIVPISMLKHLPSDDYQQERQFNIVIGMLVALPRHSVDDFGQRLLVVNRLRSSIMLHLNWSSICTGVPSADAQQPPVQTNTATALQSVGDQYVQSITVSSRWKCQEAA